MAVLNLSVLPLVATALIQPNPAGEGGIAVSIYVILLELLISVVGSVLGALIVQVLGR